MSETLIIEIIKLFGYVIIPAIFGSGLFIKWRKDNTYKRVIEAIKAAYDIVEGIKKEYQKENGKPMSKIAVEDYFKQYFVLECDKRQIKDAGKYLGYAMKRVKGFCK